MKTTKPLKKAQATTIKAADMNRLCVAYNENGFPVFTTVGRAGMDTLGLCCVQSDGEVVLEFVGSSMEEAAAVRRVITRLGAV